MINKSNPKNNKCKITKLTPITTTLVLSKDHEQKSHNYAQ
jgi:hypothetical protein